MRSYPFYICPPLILPTSTQDSFSAQSHYSVSGGSQGWTCLYLNPKSTGYLWASASYSTSLYLNLFNLKLGDGGQGGYKSYVIGLLWELNEWIQSAGTLFVFSKCFISVICSLWLQLVKNPPAMWETWVRSLGWEDPLEKGKATHSSILAWRIPWTV